MAKKSNKLGRITPVLLIIALFVGGFLYLKLFKSNTGAFGENNYLYIKTGSSYDQVFASLKENRFIKDTNSFNAMARKMNLAEHIHPGKYKIKEGMSNYQIIKMLRSGNQEVVKLVINKLRTKEQIAGKIASKLEADSAVLLKLFNDNTYLRQFGLDSNQVQCAIMPYTYDFFWNTNAQEAFEKIAKSFQDFWTEERKLKAKKLGLSIPEVIAVASLVDEETNLKKDKGPIASVYLNRLKKGMKLQADPAVRFAVGDFTIRRILNTHLRFNSPYNSYIYTGLPPGPICTPAPATIDAVLDAPKTDYIFFCADEDLKGGSNFASNLVEHEANAVKYRKALNDRGIMK